MCKGKLRKRWTCDVIDSYNQTLGFTYDKIHERPYCKVRIMTKEIVLFGIFSVLHLIVICTITRENYLFLPSKILPILLLIFTLGKSWTNLAKKGKLILIALVFSLFGDSFLALPGSGYFVPGLGSFLIAQLIYAYAFSLGSKPQWLYSLPFLLFGLTFFYFLSSHLGNLLVPVSVYISAICLMGWRAASRDANRKIYQLALFGALVFMLSDSIIAYSMFLNRELNRTIASLLIMITYYLAQVMIFQATVLEELKHTNSKST